MRQSKVSGWESEGLKVRTKSKGTAAESSESSEEVIHSLSPLMCYKQLKSLLFKVFCCIHRTVPSGNELRRKIPQDM